MVLMLFMYISSQGYGSACEEAAWRGPQDWGYTDMVGNSGFGTSLILSKAQFSPLCNGYKIG